MFLWLLKLPRRHRTMCPSSILIVYLCLHAAFYLADSAYSQPVAFQLSLASKYGPPLCRVSWLSGSSLFNFWLASACHRRKACRGPIFLFLPLENCNEHGYLYIKGGDPAVWYKAQCLNTLPLWPIFWQSHLINITDVKSTQVSVKWPFWVESNINFLNSWVQCNAKLSVVWRRRLSLK